MDKNKRVLLIIVLVLALVLGGAGLLYRQLSAGYTPEQLSLAGGAQVSAANSPAAESAADGSLGFSVPHPARMPAVRTAAVIADNNFFMLKHTPFLCYGKSIPHSMLTLKDGVCKLYVTTKKIKIKKSGLRHLAFVAVPTLGKG